MTWTWGLDGKGSLEACISPCLQALVTGTGAGCSRRGGGRAAQADSCYFRKPSVTRKAFSQSLGQSFCCLLSRCYPNSLWSSIWGHCNGAWSRVNVCVCVRVCERERMHTHADRPLRLLAFYGTCPGLIFPAQMVGGGLAATVGGDEIADRE